MEINENEDVTENKIEKKESESLNYIVAGLIIFVVQILISIYLVLSVIYIKNLGLDLMDIIAIRCGIATICSCALALIVDKKLILPTHPNIIKYYTYFGVFGFLSACGNPLLSLQAIVWTSGSFASIIDQTVPIFTTILSFALKTEKIDKNSYIMNALKIIGIILGTSCALGATAVGFVNKSTHIPATSWILGLLVKLFVCFIIACTAVFEKILFYKNQSSPFQDKPFTVSAFLNIHGCFLYIIIYIIYSALRKAPFNIPREGYIPIVYSAIVNSTICMALKKWTNKRTTPTVLGSSYSIYAVSSLLMLNMFADEKLTISQYLCCVGVVIGTTLVVLSPTISKYFQNRSR